MSRALHGDALGESHDGFIRVELATVHEECRRACYTRIKSCSLEGLNCIQRALSIVDGLELLKIQPKFGRKLKKPSFRKTLVLRLEERVVVFPEGTLVRCRDACTGCGDALGMVSEWEGREDKLHGFAELSVGRVDDWDGVFAVTAAKVCEFDHGNLGIFGTFSRCVFKRYLALLSAEGAGNAFRQIAQNFGGGIARLNRLEDDIAKMP